MTPTADPAVRAYVERILGWDSADTIDRALRSIALAAAHQAALVLRGEGDLVPIAFALHRRVVGPGAPFIVSDPRRGNTPASVRAPANRHSCAAALDAARGGTLCLRAARPPADFAQVVAALRDPHDVLSRWTERRGPSRGLVEARENRHGLCLAARVRRRQHPVSKVSAITRRTATHTEPAAARSPRRKTA